jgi:hypothetical protein
MSKKYNKLVDKVIQGLDWDSILEVHRVFKMGVGIDNDVIPGIKRKPFTDSLTKSDLKSELRALIRHAIENQIPQLSYGPWIIYWVSEEWDFDFYPEEGDESDEDPEPIEFSILIESHLEVIYSPQRISVSQQISDPETNSEGNEISLEEMLEQALEREDYETATKIRDLILKNKEKNSDK